MGFTDLDKAVIVMTTRLGDSQRPAYPPNAWHKLVRQLGDTGDTPDTLFRGTASLSDDDRQRVTQLLHDATTVLMEADELRSRGIWTLPESAGAYPATFRTRLGDNAPPVVFGAGDVRLLEQGGIGVVGSRNVTPPGAEAAQAVGRQAVRLGLPLISGGARGVDQLAMNAAYDTGGRVIGALAESLARRVRASDTLAALDAGTTCLFTHQHPNAGFTAGAAMGRNKLIYALADLTVVIASDHDTGGTWAGATEALRHGYGRVAVWRGDGEGPGNAAIEANGATSITSSADLENLLAERQSEEPTQLSLMD